MLQNTLDIHYLFYFIIEACKGNIIVSVYI